ncbi:MAG: hypothetical protein WC764_02140 [Candidatus Paceibacterota bacterium]|jgi:membrane protein DedA with SNARE-associated domain
MGDLTLLQYLTLSPAIAYFIVGVGMFVEGDIVLFTAAFVASLGYLDLGNLAMTVFICMLFGDAVWYSFGKGIRNATGNRLNKWVSKVTHPFDNHIKERPFHTIFFSKFAYGFHHAILLRAGSLKIPYPELLRADIIATFVWMLIVGGLGYGAGSWLPDGEQYLRNAGYIFLIAIFAFVFIEQLIVRQTKKRL